MSKNIYPLFITVLFFSCSNYLPYSGANEPKSITDIPLKQSAANIDCFFNNQVPIKPFYKVNIVEVMGESNVSYDELIISLKNKATAEGYDGLMFLDKQQETVYDNLRVGYHGQLATSYQKLSAVGIKYAGNINYLDTIVKSTVFEFSSGSKISTAEISFDFYGNPIAGKDPVVNNFYLDSIEPFDIYRHLLLKVKGWKYRADDVITKKVTAFKNEVNEIPVVSVKVDANDDGKFYYKIWNPTQNKISKFVLKVEKDGYGRILKKTWYKKNTIIWQEESIYDSNIITGYKRYRISNNKQQLIFTATNHFYSNKDLPVPL